MSIFSLSLFLRHKVFPNYHMACWSRGMIPALGAGGPGFKSRTGPILNYLVKDGFSLELCKIVSQIQSIIVHQPVSKRLKVDSIK